MSADSLNRGAPRFREVQRSNLALVKAINNYNATRNKREADVLAKAATRFLNATIKMWAA